MSVARLDAANQEDATSVDGGVAPGAVPELASEPQPTPTPEPSCKAREPQPVVYLLRALTSRRTYVGATVDLKRRVRQHNGELCGGARRTCAAGPWCVECYVSGFETWCQALQFEYAWRRVGRNRVKRWDVPGRMRALELLMAQERWSSRSPLASTLPLHVNRVDTLEP